MQQRIDLWKARLHVPGQQEEVLLLYRLFSAIPYLSMPFLLELNSSTCPRSVWLYCCRALSYQYLSHAAVHDKQSWEERGISNFALKKKALLLNYRILFEKSEGTRTSNIVLCISLYIYKLCAHSLVWACKVFLRPSVFNTIPECNHIFETGTVEAQGCNYSPVDKLILCSSN